MAPFFTHIFAPFALSSRLASVEIGLVHASWKNAAQRAAEKGVGVEFLACVLPDDASTVPSFARAAHNLTFYALDTGGHKLPTIGEIFNRGVQEGKGQYIVYTNIDIGTQDDFYTNAHDLLVKAESRRASADEPWVALEFTRVQAAKLREGAATHPTLDEVLSWRPIGRHPGHDCFVVPRLRVPQALRGGGLVVGMPPWGTMFHFGLQRDPGLKLLFLQGTDQTRYTFHTGAEGSSEAWMSNQDFRIQQYSEAMRLFGPEITSRAWGAKGKHSPFYLMCNAATLRFPVCDFCDAFYPASIYPELATFQGSSSSSGDPSRRTCRGVVTDRQFYSHLPVPTRTEWSELIAKGADTAARSSSSSSSSSSSTTRKKQHATKDSSSPTAFGTADRKGKRSTLTREEEDEEAFSFLARQFGGHRQRTPCKVKCIQERAKCGRLGTRSPVRPSRNSPSLQLSLPLPSSSSSSSSELVSEPASASPSMLWTFPGGFGHLWVRLLLEYGLGFFTGSVDAAASSSTRPLNGSSAYTTTTTTTAAPTITFEAAVMKHNLENRVATPPSVVHLLDDIEHCGAAAAVVHVQPMTAAAPEFFSSAGGGGSGSGGSSSSSSKEEAARQRRRERHKEQKGGAFSVQRVTHLLAPSCLSHGPFRRAIVVLRDPYRSIWSEYHRHWTAQKLQELEIQAAELAAKRQAVGGGTAAAAAAAAAAADEKKNKNRNRNKNSKKDQRRAGDGEGAETASAAAAAAAEKQEKVMMQRVQRLAFNFMTDEELDRFAAHALRMASFWNAAHADVLRFFYAHQSEQKGGQGSRWDSVGVGVGGGGGGDDGSGGGDRTAAVHFIRYEDLEPFQNGGFGDGGDNGGTEKARSGDSGGDNVMRQLLRRREILAQEAFDGAASFLGLQNVQGTSIGRTSDSGGGVEGGIGGGGGGGGSAVVSRDRIKCAFVLAKRALKRDLTRTQQLSSLDQLYEGATVCKMWAIFGGVASELGYTEPINGMPCTRILPKRNTSSISSSSSGGFESGGKVARAPVAGRKRDNCGWFNWAMSSTGENADMPLSTWLEGCMSR